MRLGDLLVRAKMVSVEQVREALERQNGRGGRLGDHLVATGALSQQALNGFLHRMPAEPGDLRATGIDGNELLGLLMKLMLQGRLESARQIVEAIKLPSHVVLELVRMALDRKLIFTRGLRAENLTEMNYALTEEGRRFAIDALEQMRYAGPAPVTLEAFTEQVNAQKLTNELVTYERIRGEMKGLRVEERFFEQAGAALNSGRAMLLYGPPGNGKTTIALRLAKVFSDVMYVPYALSVDGQIITVYDPSVNMAVDGMAMEEGSSPLVRPDGYDLRWVPCRRPCVVAGGELTLEMLELRYDETSHSYEAPLHLKALGGCFLIDDFGRQLVSPTKLLNRWIVPLESRVDYLKLHTGKSFSVPFDELVIFSTNLEPEDLMDPAFLRRLPYKIEVGPPSFEVYRQIFECECTARGLVFTEEMFDWVVGKVRHEKELELAAYQPGFLLDQVVAACRFRGLPPQMELRFLEYAIDNLQVSRRVKRAPEKTA